VGREQEIIAELWREVRPAQLELLHQLVDDTARVRRERDLEAWRRVRAATHRLAGTLGSFGQQPAGDTAVTLDRLVTGVEEPDDELLERTSALVTVLHEELVHGPEEQRTG
jgi:HPt (histidine-containing phosphotransfer) domain-containing protein